MKTIREQLELGARNSNNSLEVNVSGSIAISLKRIADNLDHLTDYFGPDKARLRVNLPEQDQ